MKKAIVLVSNDLSYDQRVAKTCSWLKNHGNEVILVGFYNRNSRPLERSYSVIRFYNPFDSGILFYAWIQIRLFFFLLFQRTNIVWSNDLDTLGPAALLRRFKHFLLVYDAHECFTESIGLIKSPFKRKLWSAVEKFSMPKVDHGITVSNGIQLYYQSKYKKPFLVLRNLPDLNVVPIQIEKPKEWEGNKILIYHGVFNPHRGLDELIDAMELLQNTILVIIGFGEHEGVLKDKVKTLQLERKVVFLGPKNYNEILGLLVHANLGIALEKPMSESFRWALPNKIFDYARMGLPFITLGNPAVKEVLEQFSIGHIISGLDKSELAESIIRILEELAITNPAIQQAQKDFLENNNASKEWDLLLSILG